ncbi:hypothetical protein [Streptomyces sp. DH8]|uniref:hypothetical protein n=1 Tax=Streptomyces sp. DH8 TaxID=2857008 RepID=UPI001E2DA1F6|nr:hypothetical protein [Streptomyces sp. DH8]
MPTPTQDLVLTALARGVAGDQPGGLKLLEPLIAAGPAPTYQLLGLLAETTLQPATSANGPGLRYQAETDDPAGLDGLPAHLQFAARFIAAWVSGDQVEAAALFRAAHWAPRTSDGGDVLMDSIIAVYAFAVAAAEHIVRSDSPTDLPSQPRRNAPLPQDNHDYDVISYVEGADKWGLDDVGLARDEAVATMLLRAFRWGDWDAVPFIKAITTGAHDPEVPYWVNDSATAAERRVERRPACFRIARSVDDGKPALPPTPAPDAFHQFEARKVEALRRTNGAEQQSTATERSAP